ncbi:MAG: DUF2868 domain-containing protein [Burkholderiaceae bacterium]|nr:DUF2868 domain-containing protein [Burkholderiaceae bacterium]
MNEHTARAVVLVRAIETADQNKEILSDEDRAYASRSARELAHWQASGRQTEATAEDFLQQRSQQILLRIAERTPAFAAFVKQRHSWKAYSLALPAIALLLGAGLDRITDPHRVDLLSAPLLLILAWNILVYLCMVVWMVMPSRRPASLLLRLAPKLDAPRKLPHLLSSALLSFAAEWTLLSARLTAARLSRTIHLSAALFGLGALASLYLRGLFSQYAAGWESTFLDAGQVHGLLSALFAPAVAIFHLQDFSLAEVAALRFPQTTAAEGGARWVHLYAATMLLVVVLPRLLLAGFGNWRANCWAQRFPLDLEHPYFRKLGGDFGIAAGGTLRVLPYSFTVDESRHKGLLQFVARLFGERGQLMLRPSIAYGAELQSSLSDVDLHADTTAVLFNLSATPEQENHGALLDYLVAASPREVIALLDESAYLERMGTQPESRTRRDERIALWQQFCAFHQVKTELVNLLKSHG